MEQMPDDGIPFLRGKVAVAGTLFLLFLGVIVWRLWDLQVLHGGAYYQQAQAETLRSLPLFATRGEIVDANGLVLARDVPSFAATLGYTVQGLSPAEIALLADILGIAPPAISTAADSMRRGTPFHPVVLRSGLTPQQHTLLVENAWRLPGVQVVAQPVRTYPGIPGDPDPGAALAANILGYVQAGPQPGDVQGADGVEQSFNRIRTPAGKAIGLAGTDGREDLEVSPGLLPLQVQNLVSPVPGDTVVLTIHARLQAVAQAALSAQLAALRTRNFGADGGPFPDAQSGAAVVLDVRTGAVLALASEPTFDPNAFAQNAAALPGSATQQQFAKQFQAWLHNPGQPFFDHAISDVQPPGSVFKPITAIAGLQSGVITPLQHLGCPATVPVGNTVLHNWIPIWGGNLDLTEAIARSCDTYFYVVGSETGIAAIDRVASEFGLGRPTGQTALQGENPGVLSSPAAAMQFYHQAWTQALTMQTSIGQGLNAFNPLEVADYVAALANGGTLLLPYFVSAVESPGGRVLWTQAPQVRNRIPLSPSIVQAIQDSMAAVTQIHPSWAADGVDADFGTAYWPFYGFSQETAQYLGRAIDVAGKTGTAQTGVGTSDGWFVSWAPANNPEIAVVVYTEHSGEGFVGGAPVAREIYDYYFGLDQAMWKAGKANQIIPPVIQMYFGLRQHYPSWTGQPPANPASASASGGGPGTGAGESSTNAAGGAASGGAGASGSGTAASGPGRAGAPAPTAGAAPSGAGVSGGAAAGGGAPSGGR